MEFGNEVGYSLGLLGGFVERKVDGSSVEFDRGIVGLPTLGADSVLVAVVVAHASALISGVR